MWYDDRSVSSDLKNGFIGLLNSKQIEFAGGGWTQNDESCLTYESIIHQMSEGHMFLNKFNVNPKISWQIDPFGHSKTFASLLSEMGFTVHVIDRIDDRYKSHYTKIPGSGSFEKEKMFQFFWDISPSNKIFVHVLDDFYTTPEYCWINEKEEMECRGYNFESKDEITNPPITNENLIERSWNFSQLIRNKAKKFRTEHLLIPFGGDFRFQNSSLQFDNMDKIIKEINSNSTYNMSLQYSTLSDYFQIIKNFSNVFPHVLGEYHFDDVDFFPYATCWYSDQQIHDDNCVAYWSGFYSTYPSFKLKFRETKVLLRRVEVLYSLSDTKEKSDFEAIQRCRETCALITHHDAITSTSNRVTMRDYLQKMNVCQDDLKFIADSLLSLSFKKEDPGHLFDIDLQFNYSLAGESVGIVPLYISNSLGWLRDGIITFFYTDKQDFSIFSFGEDGNLQKIEYDMANSRRGKEVSIIVKNIPGFGHRLYYIQKHRNKELKYTEQFEDCNGDEVKIENDLVIVTFEKVVNGHYKIISIYNKGIRKLFNIKISLKQYFSNQDGAYEFYPDHEKTSPEEMVVNNPRCVYKKNGLVISELRQYFGEEFYLVFRLANMTMDSAISNYLEYSVGIVKMSNNSEIVTTIETKIASNQILNVDSNGFEIVKRNSKTFRFNDTNWESLVSGNYYPFTRYAYIRDGLAQMNVFTLQAFGISSQRDGEVEIMLNRNTLTDDGRGVGERVDNTEFLPIVSKFLISFIDLSEHVENNLQWLKKSIEFENHLLMVFDKNKNGFSMDEYSQHVKASCFPLDNIFEHVHILDLKSMTNDGSNVILRLHNVDMEFGGSVVKMSIKDIFQSPRFLQSTPIEMSLSMQFKKGESRIAELYPNSIKTYIIDLQHFPPGINIALIIMLSLFGLIIFVVFAFFLTLLGVVCWRYFKKKSSTRYTYERIQIQNH